MSLFSRVFWLLYLTLFITVSISLAQWAEKRSRISRCENGMGHFGQGMVSELCAQAIAWEDSTGLRG